jgi:hypothetical protein
MSPNQLFKASEAVGSLVFPKLSLPILSLSLNVVFTKAFSLSRGVSPPQLVPRLYGPLFLFSSIIIHPHIAGRRACPTGILEMDILFAPFFHFTYHNSFFSRPQPPPDMHFLLTGIVLFESPHTRRLYARKTWPN